MEDWNREEWQGRRREQYETSALIVVVASACAAALGIVYILVKLF
jgi:hypothetical protein